MRAVAWVSVGTPVWVARRASNSSRVGRDRTLTEGDTGVEGVGAGVETRGVVARGAVVVTAGEGRGVAALGTEVMG
ncbi:hypothetical protein DES52_101325 [Deinococcus yavapaiensis KR-236]|uniref:Uncharacterized protein n=2 Tax=Deinococcus TaxID=1298 RepID=A0A318SCF0_9DEIO|nr:hypothetical protein DES52_101325 [Deinococcus yavapaiensis KR-236]